MDIDTRYKGIVSNYDNYTYHILGCGAIGSAAAIQIARMGGKEFFLYDMDRVSIENVGVSQYNLLDVEKRKVDALKRHLEDINEVKVTAVHGEFKQYQPQGSDIIVLGFDSMQARLDATTNVLKYKQPEYIIDGRMGAEHYQQYTFKKPTMKKYLTSWYSDEEGSEEPCNSKATAYCSSFSGVMIANTIRKICAEQPYQGKFSFNFPTMMLEKSRNIS